MRFYFVRHGESVANTRHVISNRGLGEPLTERGQEQARVLADSLRGAGITRLYSSPLLRAQQTAQVLAQMLDLPVEVTEGLREYDCGIMEGRADEEAWAAYQAVLEEWFQHGRPEARIPGGESLLDMRDRLGSLLRRLLGELGEDEQACLVGHGGLYRCALPLLMDNVSADFALAQGMPHTAVILAEPAAHIHGDILLTCLSWAGRNQVPASAAEPLAALAPGLSLMRL